jgi:hypothetical protein
MYVNKSTVAAFILLCAGFVLLRVHIGLLPHADKYVSDIVSIVFGLIALYFLYIEYDDDSHAALLGFTLWLFIYVPLLYNIITSSTTALFRELFGAPSSPYVAKLFYFLTVLPAFFVAAPLALPFIYYQLPDKYVLRIGMWYCTAAALALAVLTTLFYPGSAVFWLLFVGEVVILIFGLLYVTGWALDKPFSVMIGVGIQGFALASIVALLYGLMHIGVGLFLSLL